jgi:hypothetical protein
MQEILERHHGYTSRLRMVGQPSGSVLTATLRVPSSEYRSALTELKTVGLVEHEEEAVDEITQQHSELEARLVNAQNEEQRILQLLQNRNDKTSDSASLERQVALLRSEIERMQSERYSSDSRVTLANVSLSPGRTHPGGRDDWSETPKRRDWRPVRRFRKHLRHPALLGRPWTAPHPMDCPALFSRALLLAPTFSVDLQRGRDSKEHMTRSALAAKVRPNPK